MAFYILSLNRKETGIITSRRRSHETFVSWHIRRLTSGSFYLGHTLLICKTLSFGVYRHAGPKNNFFLDPNNPFITRQPADSNSVLASQHRGRSLPQPSLSQYTSFKPTPHRHTESWDSFGHFSTLEARRLCVCGLRGSTKQTQNYPKCLLQRKPCLENKSRYAHTSVPRPKANFQRQEGFSQEGALCVSSSSVLTYAPKEASSLTQWWQRNPVPRALSSVLSRIPSRQRWW